MTKAVFTCLRVVGVALAFQQVAHAQCYYPNGAQAPDSEKPCSSAEGSACCPDKWECQDNGLCYYDASKIYGRYSCTDKTWKSSGCPSNLCTYDMKASGAEAITQCSNHDNQWCCDANRVDVDCCQQSPSPRPFFILQDGQAYGTVGGNTGSSAPNLAAITGSALGGGSGSAPSSTPAPSSGSGSPSSNSPGSSSQGSKSGSPVASSTPVTSLQTRVSSGSAGVSTVILTVVTQAASTSTFAASATDSSGSKSHTGVIVGCAVGIPLAIVFVGIMAWLLRKRSQQKKAPPYSETPDPYFNGSSDFAGGAKLQKHTNGATTYKQQQDPQVPELAGQSIGPERPISTIKGRAELGSGAAFAPGTAPHAPHLVGVGGGNGQGVGHTPQSSWGSAPPGYSPGTNQNAWAPGHAQQPSVGSMQDGVAGGGVGAVGATQHTQGGRYIPYRAPPGHEAHGTGGAGLHNVPEMSEMSAVTTPPAEMGDGRTP